MVSAGPFFFHGFLKPISRAPEIENDAFYGHFCKFHDVFRGFSSKQTQTEQHVLWKVGLRQTPECMLA